MQLGDIAYESQPHADARSIVLFLQEGRARRAIKLLEDKWDRLWRNPAAPIFHLDSQEVVLGKCFHYYVMTRGAEFHRIGQKVGYGARDQVGVGGQGREVRRKAAYYANFAPLGHGIQQQQ